METTRRPAGGLLETSSCGPERPEGGLPQGPRHVAIIMDGNGRWAAERGQPRIAGHRAGVESIRHVVRACPDLGIEVLTLYAFSTENWKRPRAEVEALMALLLEYFHREVDQLREAGVQIRVMGRVHELPPPQRQAVEEAVRRTRGGRRLLLNLALNYGSHAELVDAFRAILDKVRRGELRPEDVDEAVIGQHLYTAGLPDPDLIIRTGGEMRLSNFLLWQAAYAELWITPVFWPDFRREHLEQAVRDFVQRERRFGAVPGQ
ncbi:isoprenyl transferase [Caldinitratiruptor microaerophilus]|uniref:Isoprenyl transferase n=1 Tax=Caldinitratiruptor microaerophilus TaxID=671077 RepID=A0AA35CL91_9FIRM|nr:isoprenyl transferase [Caldinitratiruptor microaerophilus]BDG59381.1 isoprenyl transferase [Caldinitratiruptor microaerophilus]